MNIDELIRLVRELLEAMDRREQIENDYQRRGQFALWTPEWIEKNNACINAKRKLWDFIGEAK